MLQWCFIPAVEIKDYNVIFDGQNFFDYSVKDGLRTFDNIWQIATGQGVDYITSCLFDYVYFKNYYKIMAIDLSKQKALDADPKAKQQINFTGNLERTRNTTIFSQETLRVL